MTSSSDVKFEDIENAHRAMLSALLALRNSDEKTFGSLVLTDRVGGSDAVSGANDNEDEANPTLVDALCVAAATRRPLLLTGLPGVGKSEVAYALEEFLRARINASSDANPTQSRPLNVALASYTFSSRTDREQLLGGVDYVERLAAAQDAKIGAASEHFKEGAFGAAFAPGPAQSAADRTFVDSTSPGADVQAAESGALSHEAQRSDIVVMLLDEIDKADPSIPNDLLDVLDRGEFRDDTGRTHVAHSAVFTVITSNGERDLPDAFMRRCIPHEMTVPPPDALVQIAQARMKASDGSAPGDEQLRTLAAAFHEAHQLARANGDRAPGTAEFLDAVVTMSKFGLNDPDEVIKLAPLLWSKPSI